MLDDDELAGVLAHELGHIRNRDTLIMTVAATLAGAITMLAHMAQWGAIFGFGRRDDEDSGGGGHAGLLFMAILAPIAATLIQLAISRSREFFADSTGAGIVGSPSGLARALEKLHYASQRLPMEANPATAHLVHRQSTDGGIPGSTFLVPIHRSRNVFVACAKGNRRRTVVMAEAKEPHDSELTTHVTGAASTDGDDRPQFSVNDKRFWVARDMQERRVRSRPTTPTARMPTYIENLQEQLQEKDRLLQARIAATHSEQEELRRRLARELEQRLEYATGHLLADILPVLDNLDRALQAVTEHPTLEALLEGIHLVRTQFLNVLGRHGLTPLDRQGQPFDPSLDEAMTTVEVSDPRQQNLVLQEWEKGYTLHDKVLRPAKVAVGKLLAED